MTTTAGRTGLRRALDAANIPCLTMCLVQLTGDLRWLDEPYAPTRARGLDDHDTGGLPDDVQDEIRDAAAAAVEAYLAGAPVAIEAPRGELLLRMLRTSTGEPVGDEFEPMMAETLGSAEPEPVPHPVVPDGFDALVIGAGVGGLLAVATLRAMGVPVTAVERNTEVAGTWWENHYPGAGVDTPSHLYSYSFRPHPWSTAFGRRDEVFDYLRDYADDADLRRSIEFGAEVEAAAWDDDARRWAVTVRRADGSRETRGASVLISAVGQLNRPTVPDLPGLDSFEGPLFHSARWPDLDLAGRRVAVVGTGASAMQIVPRIAGRAGSVTIFQRSPQWIAPHAGYFDEIGADRQQVLAEVPFYAGWYRTRLAWTFNDKVHPALVVDPDWEHPERSVNAANDGHRRHFTRYLEAELEGRPDLVAKALPHYPPFGKRMLLDNGWFAALRRDDVELVTEAVASVGPSSVRTASGAEHAANVVVMATGFAAHEFLAGVDVRGRSGRRLTEEWGDDDARAHLGMTVPGFPNLFLLSGPNTALGHGGSQITIIELQMRAVARLVAGMLEHGSSAIEVRREVAEAYDAEVDEAHAGMIWTHPGMTNWYRNAAGRVVNTLPWRIVDYRARLEASGLDDHELR
ncbi:flavin-containing monooxygenase [Actinomycetospora termitidis]|uniref:NAD(P)/FAD-dependent oxidoreductase n=1 Tax=Actinomycetospora termitidis TaxID=3053470 RepID=A0ABT7MEH7_9PSEU|nr:NAD(P)/FAD-dependent oxidoreductase [Actinomycetospora sp. Odt1-22]MDL5159070.1 NAD(P)/FAD-dependent oxidoreductase [Actinomycetospora sp. Odt1-22]